MFHNRLSFRHFHCIRSVSVADFARACWSVSPRTGTQSSWCMHMIDSNTRTKLGFGYSSSIAVMLGAWFQPFAHERNYIHGYVITDSPMHTTVNAEILAVHEHLIAKLKSANILTHAHVTCVILITS